MRRILALIASTLLALASLMFLAPVVMADAGPPPASPSTEVLPKKYKFAGDSYTAGAGAWHQPSGVLDDGRLVIRTPLLTEPSPAEVEAFDKCHRPYEGTYAALLMELPEVDGRNIACGGITINDFLYGKAETGEPSQLDQLRQEDEIIFLTLGGNDLPFGNIFWCVSFKSDCVATNPDEEVQHVLNTADGVLGGLPDRLFDVLQQIRKRAPNAMIIPVLYPEPFGAPGPVGIRCMGIVSEGERQMSTNLLLQLNGAWKQAVARFTQTVDGRAAYMDPMAEEITPPPGYEGAALVWDACSASANHLINGYESSNRPERDDIHPNALGHYGLFAAAMRFLAKLGILAG